MLRKFTDLATWRGHGDMVIGQAALHGERLVYWSGRSSSKYWSQDCLVVGANFWSKSFQFIFSSVPTQTVWWDILVKTLYISVPRLHSLADWDIVWIWDTDILRTIWEYVSKEIINYCKVSFVPVYCWLDGLCVDLKLFSYFINSNIFPYKPIPDALNSDGLTSTHLC